MEVIRNEVELGVVYRTARVRSSDIRIYRALVIKKTYRQRKGTMNGDGARLFSIRDFVLHGVRIIDSDARNGPIKRRRHRQASRGRGAENEQAKDSFFLLTKVYFACKIMNELLHTREV